MIVGESNTQRYGRHPLVWYTVSRWVGEQAHVGSWLYPHNREKFFSGFVCEITGDMTNEAEIFDMLFISGDTNADSFK